MKEPAANDLPEETELEPAEWDELFDALAADRRRAVLFELAEHGGPLSVQALARTVLERRGRETEAGAPPVEVTSERVERLRIELYHVHLPKLAAADLVAFDEETRRTSVTERTATGVELLEELR